MRVMLASLLGPALAPGIACAQDGYGYGPHMMWWGGGFGMILGPIVFIVGLAVAIALALALARWIGGAQGPAAAAPRTALDILKERFARGEIDKAEYEDRRRTLQD